MFTNTQAVGAAASHPPAPAPSPSPSPSPSSSSSSSSSSSKQVYIVYISDKPPQGVDPDTYYIKFLTPVVGSVKAAKEALLYSYGIVSGFAAKLTPDQATRLKKQSEVTYVIREIKYWLNGDDDRAKFRPYQPAARIHS
ncbi:Subtilisin-like protease SBT5.6 [Sesamum alatum]|uniref:Subtilisin-like protease SBT5.6 n=1 Tax=Sesamum alatum TaxID=300844 RepID=A0AAE1YP48_9LAMI|nr:Subtilisin-like protease SBT5.6 [Sesamum alatum]